MYPTTSKDSREMTRVAASRRATTRARVGRVVLAATTLSVATVLTTPMDSTGAATVGAHAGHSGASAARGLRIEHVSGRVFGVSTMIHAVSFDSARYRVRIVLAHHALDAGVQTPRAMCRATRGCLAAVNADFFDMTRPGRPDPGDAVGGIIRDCVLLHTPEISHQQANVDNGTLTQNLDWSDTLDVSGAFASIAAINQELPMSYSRVSLSLSGLLLYTSDYALATPTAPGRTTYEFAFVGGSATPTNINSTAQLELVGTRHGAHRVASGEVDISAPPGSILSTLHLGQTISSRTRSSAGCDNIGGHPILMDHGAAVPVAAADTYMSRPFARTVIGWTASKRTVLVTVDGRDGISGATAPQLVRILRSLHVVSALDLDGGDSSTLYARGRTQNRPSLGRERPVSTALVVVAVPSYRPGAVTSR